METWFKTVMIIHKTQYFSVSQVIKILPNNAGEDQKPHGSTVVSAQDYAIHGAHTSPPLCLPRCNYHFNSILWIMKDRPRIGVTLYLPKVSNEQTRHLPNARLVTENKCLWHNSQSDESLHPRLSYVA